MNEANGSNTDSMDSDSLNTLKKYEEVLEKDPASPTFVFLAQILYKQNKLEQAIGVLIRGLRYNNNNITGRFLLGKIYYERWMIEPAKKELETVFGLAPDNLAAGKMLVEIYKSEENFEKALEILRFVYEFHPSDTGIQSGIKELMETIEAGAKTGSEDTPTWGNFQAPAETKIEKTTGPVDATADEDFMTETMADLYMEQGVYDKAISIYENILADYPDNPSVRRKLQEWRLKEANKLAGFSKEE